MGRPHICVLVRVPFQRTAQVRTAPSCVNQKISRLKPIDSHLGTENSSGGGKHLRMGILLFLNEEVILHLLKPVTTYGSGVLAEQGPI